MATSPAGADRRDFFVSYTAADKGWAEWIAWHLEEAGHTVLVQAWDMVPGSNWLHVMNQATKFAERTIVVLSAAYLADSVFGETEWLAAYRRDPAGLAGRVIPVRIEDCTVDGLLAAIVYADLAGAPDKAVAKEILLQAVRAALARRNKPLEEPEFPGAGPQRSTEGVSEPGDSATSGTLARSDYVAQVRQIAPGILHGRDTELAAMAAFCTDAAAGPYVWWRAAAWTGKTALMATWVLDPPPGVQVVSFFITARYAGNSDRAAYVEVVNEQLATLLGQALPPYLTPPAQERLYWSLLTRAAEHCRQQGERLILAVDGLDEDRGVTTSPEARSIAALLPANPPSGMRVVVAGRPDPPIPADVPPGHPLRDKGVVWLLRRSEHAAAVRADMLADLARLRDGSATGRDVLGLVTAAGGGLASRDLAELCLAAGHVVTDWDIEQLLATVAGRSFASRDHYWQPGTDSVAYVLGHEEIQQEATRSYGKIVLAGYRDGLHTWAESYRDRQWPPDTPEYLLRGYYRLLLAIGDLERATECATDLARHDRMLDLSGGDTAALAEITDAQNAILATPQPDLRWMARLAYHRGRIIDRNSYIPSGLPAVWALLGQGDRAEQLARAITSQGHRLEALSSLAAAFAAADDHDRARAVAGEAEQAARAIPGALSKVWAQCSLSGTFAEIGDHDHARALIDDAERTARDLTENLRSQALLSLAMAIARAGDFDRAERTARTITTEYLRAHALSRLAAALAEAGQHDRAEEIAITITKPDTRARTLINLATALASAGEHDRARTMVGDAEQAARNLTGPFTRPDTLIDLATALAATGEHDRARTTVGDAEQAARNLSDPDMRTHVLGGLATALAAAGDHARAERTARTITDQNTQANALISIATALAAAGDQDRARAVAADAEQSTRTIAEPNTRAPMLSYFATTLANAGDHNHARAVAVDAEHTARTVTQPVARARGLINLTTALTAAGDPNRARTVASHAEHTAHDISAPDARAETLSSLATALAAAGDHDRARALADDAEQTVRTITDPDRRERLLSDLATALANAGDHDHAERIARTITDPDDQTRALSSLATALAAAGEHDRAERTARTITNPGVRTLALCAVATATAAAGDRDRARALADYIEYIATEYIAHEYARAETLSNLATALAVAGDHDRARAVADEAERIAYAISDPDSQEWALSSLVTALAAVGNHDRARAAADAAEQAAQVLIRPTTREGRLRELTATVAKAGYYDRAERIARTIAVAQVQALSMGDLTLLLTKAGHFDRAERIARTITDPNTQAQALIIIAAALADTGRHHHARKLVAVALSIGEWGELPLDKLSRFAAEVPTTLFDCALSPTAPAPETAVQT